MLLSYFLIDVSFLDSCSLRALSKSISWTDLPVDLVSSNLNLVDTEFPLFYFASILFEFD
jgi:hypothetical protein